ncbi:MAG: PepSY domain-containing protein [Gammaproteobacteria bacterium]|nr:PepSY domain-containing protein [Gammaproteobacteria bacterium]
MVTAGLMLAAPLLSAQTRPEAKLAAQASLSLQQARAIALKAFPGKIIKQELEHEKGGSGLRYSFDIRHGKLVHEVGVDAKTGKLLENSDDSNNSD